MKLSVRQEGGVTVLTPVGPMVIGPGEQEMHEAVARLLSERQVRLVFDMSGVTKADSSGIESLLNACRQARERGGDARLAGVSQRLRTLLEISQLTNVLELYADVNEAVSSYTARP